MFKDRGMMEHPICPGLDCKLTDSSLFVRYKKLSSSQIYFWPGKQHLAYSSCLLDSIKNFFLKKNQKKSNLNRHNLYLLHLL